MFVINKKKLFYQVFTNLTSMRLYKLKVLLSESFTNDSFFVFCISGKHNLSAEEKFENNHRKVRKVLRSIENTTVTNDSLNGNKDSNGNKGSNSNNSGSAAIVAAVVAIAVVVMSTIMTMKAEVVAVVTVQAAVTYTVAMTVSRR